MLSLADSSAPCITASAEVQFEIVRSLEAFAPYAAAWDALVEQCPEAGFFCSRPFLETFMSYFPGQMCFALARENSGQLIAAAPFIITSGAHGFRRWLRHLTLAGNLTEACPEQQNILLAPSAPPMLANAMVQHLLAQTAKEWDLLHLPSLNDNYPSRGGLDLPSALLPIALPGEQSACIRLPDTWEEYLRSLSASFRKSFQKRWRKLESVGKLDLLEAGKDIPVEQALQELYRLHDLRFGASSPAFAKERSQGYHAALAARLAKQRQLALLLLSLDGKIIAAGYDFLHQGKAWSFQSGWDPEYAAYGLGHIMTAYSVRWCMEQRGIRAYDFLAGDVEYKACWNPTIERLRQLRACNPKTLRGWLWRLLTTLRVAPAQSSLVRLTAKITVVGHLLMGEMPEWDLMHLREWEIA